MIKILPKLQPYYDLFIDKLEYLEAQPSNLFYTTSTFTFFWLIKPIKHIVIDVENLEYSIYKTGIGREYSSAQYQSKEQLMDELIIFKELILPKYLDSGNIEG